MRYSAIDGVVRRRQSLAQHLSAEYLRTANVAAFATEDVVLDAFELKKFDQVFKYRMHLLRRRQRQYPHH